MGRLLRSAITGAHRASLKMAARRFHAAAASPAEFQQRILQRTLAQNARSDYGREHGFRDVRGARSYQDRVPVSDHETMRPWWDAVARGQSGVLTQEDVLMMERSGGSSGVEKLVPYTRGLLDEFSSATGAWLADLYAHVPRLRKGLQYWSISPVAGASRRTSGGIPIGFEDDTQYFSPLQRWALRRLMAVPPEVARSPDWRQETLRHLVAAGPDLALLSVWSPTFLMLLLDEVKGRSARDIWPRLGLVSCWTDGASAAFVPSLRRLLPHAPIQGKGLLATEGVVTIPLMEASAPVLATTSHFYEFLDLDRPRARPLLAHELEPAGRYSPLLTTAGGLYRYHLKDVVRCVGRWRRAPMLRFEGRLDRVADLCGEKVSEAQAARALERAWAKLGARPAFAMLAPSLEPRPHYRLHIESDAPGAVLDALAQIVDEALAASHPYRYCRQLGQLNAVRAVRVRDGARTVERVLARDGQRVGAIKPSPLDPRPRWDDAFGAKAGLP